MEDFHHKGRFITGGITTDTPHAMHYASMLSRESVRTALTLTDLNDLDIKMTDIENDYLTDTIT
jgi:hypothetical protein